MALIFQRHFSLILKKKCLGAPKPHLPPTPLTARFSLHLSESFKAF
jgi:hypothetical protein